MTALEVQHPSLSAHETTTYDQQVFLIWTAALTLLLGVIWPIGVGVVVFGVITVVYAAATYYRLQCIRYGLRAESVLHVSDARAHAISDRDLPRYTLLVPAYKEPEVIRTLVTALDELDYPAAKLEVLILLEADDPETLEAVRAASPSASIKVVVVPEGEVTTKPRACNYGLQLATGELVTIFDAEDIPEPLQLRRAAIAFADAGPQTVCLQARLTYYNADQNIITRWFAAEYLTWFNHVLPGLTALGSPIPLGGTSNHIRTDVLRGVGGWDPYNVTEDADLGVRLARLGHTVGVLDSLTAEEANSDFINWVKQRSRWYKGYLQTWLVHMRHPRQLRREVGWRGLAGLNLFIGGTPLLSLINPLMWGLTLLWFLGHPHIIEQLFPAPISYVALLTWVVGNIAVIYGGLVSIREVRREELWASALLVPAYWVMMALAATKAMVQLVRNPSFWEKTTHGLHMADGPAAQPPLLIAVPSSPVSAKAAPGMLRPSAGALTTLTAFTSVPAPPAAPAAAPLRVLTPLPLPAPAPSPDEPVAVRRAEPARQRLTALPTAQRLRAPGPDRQLDSTSPQKKEAASGAPANGLERLRRPAKTSADG